MNYIFFYNLSFQSHAAQDTCKLWNSGQAIGLNHKIPFHLYTAGAPLQDMILKYPETIPWSVIKMSRNYTSYWLSAGINSSLSNISAGIAYHISKLFCIRLDIYPVSSLLTY